MTPQSLHGFSLCPDDLSSVFARTRTAWDKMRGKKVFVTGGTGFFGKWLLETFAYANDQLQLDAELVVLSREPQIFLEENAHLRSFHSIRFHQGDVRHFVFPAGEFSHIIHAATEASASLNKSSPKEMFDVIVDGTRHVLDFSKRCGAERLLLTSSGAVYGKQPSRITHLGEDYVRPADTDDDSAYAEGKRIAEDLCAEASSRNGLILPIARCFAFVGPYLPLNRHFAIGNFLRDALSGGPIVVRGDGKAKRSYMYAADLAAWLWTILFCGESCRPYNVGSDLAISIRDVAHAIAEWAGCTVEVLGLGLTDAASQSCDYVPATDRVRRELGLQPEIDFPEAIKRTFAWYQGRADNRVFEKETRYARC